MNDFIIRPMTLHDLPGVLKVEEEAFPLHPYGVADYQRYLSDSKVQASVGIANDEVVAIQVMHIGRGAPWQVPQDDPKSSYLDEIAVASKAHGNKVGEQMVLYGLFGCIASGVNQCALWVFANANTYQDDMHLIQQVQSTGELTYNNKAIRLYLKLGFEPQEIEVQRYETREHGPLNKVKLHMLVTGMQDSDYRKKLEGLRAAIEIPRAPTTVLTTASPANGPFQATFRLPREFALVAS